MTVLILWSAVASVFALLLAYSRVPYAAALDGYFWKPFARLHPNGDFPYVSLLVIGGLAIAGGMLSLDWVVSAILTARIVIQFVGPDCGGGGVAQNASGRAAAVPDVAVSAAQRAGAGGMGVRVCDFGLDVCSVRAGGAGERGGGVWGVAAMGRRRRLSLKAREKGSAPTAAPVLCYIP